MSAPRPGFAGRRVHATANPAGFIAAPTVANGAMQFTSLDGVTVPEGVTLTVTMKSYSTLTGEADATPVGASGTMTVVGGGSTTGTITVEPSSVDNVKYYKFDIAIGATSPGAGD